MDKDIFSKNRDRVAQPDFANINLLARCNADCFFCLGKDLGEEIAGRQDTNVHFSQWTNWNKFLAAIKEAGVNKVYLTGQNTDSLLYHYLDELIEELHKHGFKVGLRTNGALALRRMDSINKCELSTGYSIHTLRPEVNRDIMGWNFVPDWDTILKRTNKSRVAMVLNRFNIGEFYDVVRFVSQYPNVGYVQARRISTDDRQAELLQDAVLYEKLFKEVSSKYPMIGGFFGAPIYMIEGVSVTFWRTVKTDISSINYFTDGTISNMYFVVEGYRLNKIHREPEGQK